MASFYQQVLKPLEDLTRGFLQYLTLIIMTLIIIRFYEETQCIEIIEKADYQHQNTCLSLTNEWDSRHEEILRAKRFQTLYP